MTHKLLHTASGDTWQYIFFLMFLLHILEFSFIELRRCCKLFCPLIMNLLSAFIGGMSPVWLSKPEFKVEMTHGRKKCIFGFTWSFLAENFLQVFILSLAFNGSSSTFQWRRVHRLWYVSLPSDHSYSRISLLCFVTHCGPFRSGFLIIPYP